MKKLANMRRILLFLFAFLLVACGGWAVYRLASAGSRTLTASAAVTAGQGYMLSWSTSASDFTFKADIAYIGTNRISTSNSSVPLSYSVSGSTVTCHTSAGDVSYTARLRTSSYYSIVLMNSSNQTTTTGGSLTTLSTSSHYVFGYLGSSVTYRQYYSSSGYNSGTFSSTYLNYSSASYGWAFSSGYGYCLTSGSTGASSTSSTAFGSYSTVYSSYYIIYLTTVSKLTFVSAAPAPTSYTISLSTTHGHFVNSSGTTVTSTTVTNTSSSLNGTTLYFVPDLGYMATMFKYTGSSATGQTTYSSSICSAVGEGNSSLGYKVILYGATSSGSLTVWCNESAEYTLNFLGDNVTASFESGSTLSYTSTPYSISLTGSNGYGFESIDDFDSYVTVSGLLGGSSISGSVTVSQQALNDNILTFVITVNSYIDTISVTVSPVEVPYTITVNVSGATAIIPYKTIDVSATSVDNGPYVALTAFNNLYFPISDESYNKIDGITVTGCDYKVSWVSTNADYSEEYYVYVYIYLYNPTGDVTVTGSASVIGVNDTAGAAGAFTIFITPAIAFLSADFFGGYSFIDILCIPLFICLALIFLKFFAGG